MKNDSVFFNRTNIFLSDCKNRAADKEKIEDLRESCKMLSQGEIICAIYIKLHHKQQNFG